MISRTEIEEAKLAERNQTFADTLPKHISLTAPELRELEHIQLTISHYDELLQVLLRGADLRVKEALRIRGIELPPTHAYQVNVAGGTLDLMQKETPG